MTDAESESDEVPGELVCEVCGKRFESEEELRRHVHEQGIVD